MFDVRMPNAETATAMQELEASRGRRFKGVDSLLTDLDADD